MIYLFKTIYKNYILFFSIFLIGSFFGYYQYLNTERVENYMAQSDIDIKKIDKVMHSKYRDLENVVINSRVKSYYEIDENILGSSGVSESSFILNKEYSLNVTNDISYSEGDLLKLFLNSVLDYEIIYQSILENFEEYKINNLDVNQFIRSVEVLERANSHTIRVKIYNPPNEKFAESLLLKLIHNSISKVNIDYIIELNKELSNYEIERKNIISKYISLENYLLSVFKNNNYFSNFIERERKLLEEYENINQASYYINNDNKLNPIIINYSYINSQINKIGNDREGSVTLIAFIIISFLISLIIVLFKANFINKSK
tara:strand:+ start:1712 stop:2662 length:951 start_codon:yes stop_codon:yes gene_type:complete